MCNRDVSIIRWQFCCWGLCWKVCRLHDDENIERTWTRYNRIIQHFLVISTLVCCIISEALWGKDWCFLLCFPRADTIRLHCWLGFQGITRIKMWSDVFQGCNPHSRKFLLFAENFQTQNINFSWKFYLWEIVCLLKGWLWEEQGDTVCLTFLGFSPLAICMAGWTKWLTRL